jgi:hypothetical protein
MIRFDRSAAGGLVLAAILFVFPRFLPAPVPQAEPPAAVGTYKLEDVVVAYYKSAVFAEKMKALHAEHADAKKRGDESKVRELEQRGEALQERAHQQYDGEAAIPEILDLIRPAFPEIAKAAGVGAIVEDFVWKDPAFKTVDDTDRMVARLVPNK